MEFNIDLDVLLILLLPLSKFTTYKDTFGADVFTLSVVGSCFLTSSGQPLFFLVPFTLGHLSSLSATPSLSESGQPFSFLAPFTLGQSSLLSAIPSLSLSGQPPALVRLSYLDIRLFC
ncbi:MAG: hypothetical protein P8N00_04850, partial [Flavobacteriales bacterium]|nr:hypothetical protein [Flavobacteriales bacterium]